MNPSETLQKCIYTGKRIIKNDSRYFRKFAYSGKTGTRTRYNSPRSYTQGTMPVCKALLQNKIFSSAQHRQGRMHRVKRNTEETEIL